MFIPIIVALLALNLCWAPSWAAISDKDLESLKASAQEAMSSLGVEKNSKKLLLLTNAYYGQMGGQGAEKCRDILSEVTGCSSGDRNLLDVHSSFNEPLWFALFNKEKNEIIYGKWTGENFKTQTIDASEEKLLKPEAWKQASSGIVGRDLYKVSSISLSWAQNADWKIMKTAGFHDHLCPGVNIGFLTHVFLEEKMPLGKGESYNFFGALPKCYMDTLQVIYNATMGKQMAYGVTMGKDQLAKYEKDGALPSIVALKINKKKDTCEGVVLGFSWKRIMDDLGLNMEDFAPKGGPANPVFFISRVKACKKMAQLPLEKKMAWLVEMQRFNGDVKLAKMLCNAGGDPYAIVWNK